MGWGGGQAGARKISLRARCHAPRRVYAAIRAAQCGGSLLIDPARSGQAEGVVETGAGQRRHTERRNRYRLRGVRCSGGHDRIPETLLTLGQRAVAARETGGAAVAIAGAGQQATTVGAKYAVAVQKVRTAGANGINEGILTLRHTVTVANIFSTMPIGLNQTTIAAYTVPAGKILLINRMFFPLSRANNQAGSAEVALRCRELGGVFTAAVDPEITNSSPYEFENNGYLVFPALTDIKVRCESASANGTIITADLGGVLVDATE